MITLVDRILLRVSAVALAASVAASCGGDDDGGGVSFELRVSPEFVQGLYGDTPVNVLVEVVNAEPTDQTVTIDASATGGATVEVSQGSVAAGEVAKVSVVASPVSEPEEKEVVLTITGSRGGVTETATRTIIVMPGEDDREREILGFFLDWLADEHPDIGLQPTADLEEVVVAPRLLVVSHYMFEGAGYELGLSWHIMVAPDDWSELYLRPLDEFAPTRAFRLSSWSTAINRGDYEFTEVQAPAEVVR